MCKGETQWIYKEHLINHIGFPWALSENLRSNIIRPGILKDNEIQEYVLNKYSWDDVVEKTLKIYKEIEKWGFY